MKKLISLLFGLALLTGLAAQDVYYIATDGNDDTGDGSIGNPWGTFQKGIDATTTAGDTVYFRGGTYYSQNGNSINPTSSRGASGEYGNPVVYSSYPGEWAIFDCSAHCGNGATYNSFIAFSYVEHIHIKNMEIKNLFQCQAVNTGAIATTYSRNLEFHHLIIHDISSPRGFWMQGGAWAGHAEDPYYPGTPEAYWGTVAEGGNIDTTRFINVDVYNTCDTLGGGNAGDGWKGVWYPDNHVEWIGCRAWNYSDDGLDPNNIGGATFVVKNSWFRPTNKYERFDIEGNGGKFTAMNSEVNATHPGDYPWLRFENVIMADLEYMAYLDNLYPDRDYYLNTKHYGNIAYKARYGWQGATNATETSIYRNNIGYKNTSNSSNDGVQGSNNTFAVTDWSDSLTITEWDFLSLDLNELTKDRQADGSLPDINTFKLRGSSQLIDAGINPPDEDYPTGYTNPYTRDSAGVTAVTHDIGYWEYEPYTGDTDLDILSVTLDEQIGYATYDYDLNTVEIDIRYMYRNQISSLTPIVLPSDGDTISPGFKTIVDFTNPVTYTVSEIGNSSRSETWTVTVNIGEPSTLANIRSFDIGNLLVNSDSVANTVSVFNNLEIDVSNIAPSIDIDLGATISPPSGVAQDFSSGPVIYTVTAEDEVTQEVWTVTVSSLEITSTSEELGFTAVFPTASSNLITRYVPYVADVAIEITTLSIYHNGSTGGLLMAVYDGGTDYGDGVPTNRLRLCDAVSANTYEGWQHVDLPTPLALDAGDKIWIGFVFEEASGYRILDGMYGAPEMGYSDTRGHEYGYGLRDPAHHEMGGWNFFASVYASADGEDPPDPPDPPIIGRGKPVRSIGKTYIKNGKVYLIEH